MPKSHRRADRFKSRTPVRALAPAARAFMCHPRHVPINFNPHRRAFMLDGRGSLQGLTRFLDAHFIPPAAELAAYSGGGAARAPHDARCQATGTAHGSLVDAQLQQWIEGRATLAHADPCAARLARGMTRLGLRPVAAQAMVYDERPGARWATAVDALAVNARGALVVLEFKCTRHPDIYTRESGKHMRGVLHAQPYSLWSHHQMQLAMPVAAMRRLYGTRVAAAYVLVASPPDALDVYPLQPTFLRAAMLTTQ